MLKTRKLTVHYGPLLALHEVTLEVNRGEMVSLIGPNRAGKTTLLLTLSGILKTSEGRILLEEEEIANLEPHRIVAKGIGHVPQGRHVFPTLSVTDNLMLGTYRRAHTEVDLRNGLGEIYGLFPVLKERGRQRAGTMSGGEQQMLAIGRALMGRPRILLLDEPSTGLAPSFYAEIFTKLGELNRKGLTLLIIDQEVRPLLKMAHRGYLMRNGRIIKEGPARILLEDPEVQTLY